MINKVWYDLLCSACYLPIELGRKSDSYMHDSGDNIFVGEEPVYCERCDGLVFPIVICKREYDITTPPKITADDVIFQTIERDIKHGVEIVGIWGDGIITSLGVSSSG